MNYNPYVQHYLDDNNEYRARIVTANGEVLFVSSEGHQRKEDLIVSQELARQTLNAAYYSDPTRTDATMARRDARLSHSRLANVLRPADRGNALSAFRDNPPPRKLANALLRRRSR